MAVAGEAQIQTKRGEVVVLRDEVERAREPQAPLVAIERHALDGLKYPRETRGPLSRCRRSCPRLGHRAQVHLGAHVVGAEDPPRRLRKTLALYYAFVFQNLVVRTATMPGELKGF